MEITLTRDMALVIVGALAVAYGEGIDGLPGGIDRAATQEAEKQLLRAIAQGFPDIANNGWFNQLPEFKEGRSNAS